MAISKLSKKQDYEVTATHELLFEGNGLGIMFEVRSDLCEAAKKSVKRQSAAAVSLSLAQQNGENDEAVERWIDKQKDIQLDRLIACTVSIDWGKEEWEKGKGPLPFDRDGLSVMYAEEWIVVQVSKWIKDLTDFIEAS